eukprot:s573_g11.t1
MSAQRESLRGEANMRHTEELDRHRKMWRSEARDHVAHLEQTAASELQQKTLQLNEQAAHAVSVQKSNEIQLQSQEQRVHDLNTDSKQCWCGQPVVSTSSCSMKRGILTDPPVQETSPSRTTAIHERARVSTPWGELQDLPQCINQVWMLLSLLSPQDPLVQEFSKLRQELSFLMMTLVMNAPRLILLDFHLVVGLRMMMVLMMIMATEALQDSGKFVTHDAKLTSSLTNICEGDFARQLDIFKEEQADNGTHACGPQALLMIHKHFSTSRKHGALHDIEDLMAVQLVNDDLRGFITRWDAVIAGMTSEPDVLWNQACFHTAIKNFRPLSHDLAVYDRTPEGEPKRSYEFLMKAARDFLERKRLETMRQATKK